MSVDNLPGQSLALRFRHLAVELRRASGHTDAKRAFGSLWMSMAKVMLDAYKLRQLPKLFLDEIDRDYIPGIAIERYYNLTIPSAVVGYVEPVEESIPDMPNKDGTIDKGNRFVLLKPGSITLVWPGLFEDIWCWNNDEDPERSIDYFWGHKFRSDADIERIIATAADNNRFTIMGYYATACDLLAEWIENHADDDHGDQGGEQTVEPFPNDGLDEEGKAFEWGGCRFDRLTGGMMKVLKVLHDEHKKGHPNVPSAMIGHRANVSIDSGVKSQVFKVNRKDWPVDATGKKPLHPVSEIVIDNGDGTHRLIDPDKVPAKVPAGS